jgi:NADH dehydrogenase (ubiquinone) flavoprotein 2
MIQINDDYYEDLTPEKTIALLDALKATAQAEIAAEGEGAKHPQQGLGSETGKDEHVKSGKGIHEESGKVYDKAGGVKMPSPGPLSARKSCENSKGLTNLTSEMWGPEVFRKDL